MQDQQGELGARLETALAERSAPRRRSPPERNSRSAFIPLPEVSVPPAKSERCLPAVADLAQIGTLSDNRA